MPAEKSHLVDIGDCQLYVVERGEGYPVLLLHGGPGLDHHIFGDYLDALTDNYRLILVDQRSQGRSTPSPEETWTLEQHARDVGLLAAAMELSKYAVLGHSYGAFVALQNAVDFPGQAAQTIVDSGVPASRFLEEYVHANLESFEPESLRKQVTDSWEREPNAQTQEDVASLWREQLPFHFANPFDQRIAEYGQRTAGAIYAPDVLRRFSNAGYGGIDVEDRLGEITQPVLVLAGRHDRACSAAAAEAIAAGTPDAELVFFDHSAHMSFVEENETFIATVRRFLNQHIGD